MTDNVTSIPSQQWVIEKEGFKTLQPPSGKGFRVIDILAVDGNTYSVIEPPGLFHRIMEKSWWP